MLPWKIEKQFMVRVRWASARDTNYKREAGKRFIIIIKNYYCIISAAILTDAFYQTCIIHFFLNKTHLYKQKNL